MDRCWFDTSLNCSALELSSDHMSLPYQLYIYTYINLQWVKWLCRLQTMLVVVTYPQRILTNSSTLQSALACFSLLFWFYGIFEWASLLFTLSIVSNHSREVLVKSFCKSITNYLPSNKEQTDKALNACWTLISKNQTSLRKDENSITHSVGNWCQQYLFLLQLFWF